MGANALACWTHFCWCVINAWKRQLHDNNNSYAGPRYDNVPLAYDNLGHVYNRCFAGFRASSAYRCWVHAVG